jgi:flagellin-like protein
MKGVSTVIATILMLVITISLSAFAYAYMQGMFTREISVVLGIDESTSCVNNNITVLLDNSGTSIADASKIRISGTAANGTAIPETNCTTSATPVTINSGSTYQCANPLVGSAGFNTVRAKDATGRTRTSTVACV